MSRSRQRQRALDLGLGVPLAAAGAPVAALTVLRLMLQGQRPFVQRTLRGPDRAFQVTDLNVVGALAELPRLLAVLRGQMSLVGTEPLPLEGPQTALTRLDDTLAAPGLVSLHGLRRNVNLAHEDVEELNRRYSREKSLAGDLSLLLRAGVAALLAGPGGAASAKLRLLGVEIDNLSLDGAIESISRQISADARSAVMFVNAHCLNVAQRDPRYLQILRQAQLVLPDGIGLHLAARILGQQLRENVNGTDLFVPLCRRLAREERAVFLLGGRRGVARGVARRLATLAPGLRVAGVQHGYFERGGAAEAQLVDRINASGADLLLVALGVPGQERWIAEHRGRLKTPVVMGVGGLFDFYSGRIPRAPRWMQEVGMEWVHRLACEPRRMARRYILGNPEFLLRTLVQRLGPAALPAPGEQQCPGA
jgi:N-acetylglucosaminyldiphosphoundecaprenol N-acetyl-beta-D-mannosaminyltransferase